MILDLSPVTQSYLRDHSLGGRPTLPLAAALDMLLWSQGCRPPFCLTEVRVERGVALRTATRLEARNDEGRLTLFEIRPTGREVPAFRARLERSVPRTPPVRPRGEDLPSRLTLEDFYRFHTFHGPRLQGILRVTRRTATSLEGLVATCRPADWQDPRREWHLDPLAVDSAFQLAIYFAQASLGQGLLPRAVERLALLRPLGPGPVEVRLDVVHREGEDLYGEVRFESGGRLCGWMEGVRARLAAAELFRR